MHNVILKNKVEPKKKKKNKPDRLKYIPLVGGNTGVLVVI